MPKLPSVTVIDNAIRAHLDKLSEPSLTPGERASARRAIGEQLALLRGHFTTGEGVPDVAGASWDYRQHVSRLWADSGFDAETIARHQNAIRQHIGTFVRQLWPDEVQAAGMVLASPEERSRDRKRSKTVEVNAARATAGPGAGDAIKSLGGALKVLQRLDLAAVRALSGKDARLAAELLDTLAARVAELRERAGQPMGDVQRRQAAAGRRRAG